MIFPKIQQTLSAVADHYDALDVLYRTVWGEQLHHGYWLTGQESQDEAVKNLVRSIALKANLKSGMHLCDIGCGYGATARQLVQEYDVSVTGITISKKQYEHAISMSKTKEEPTYLLSDWLNNTLASSSFDAAISIESSEHMDKEYFLHEAFRILKPSGRLVTSAWLSKPNPSTMEKTFLLEPICREGHLHSLGSSEEYLHLLKEVGFEKVIYQDITSEVAKTWTICLLRIIKMIATDLGVRNFILTPSAHRSFIKTIFRMRLAYAIGSMKYGIFTATKR